MKKIMMIGFLIITIFLIGCSSIPTDEIESYCNETGLIYTYENENSFTCSKRITDDEYRQIKIYKCINKSIDTVENCIHKAYD